jgi:hypothetical protein
VLPAHRIHDARTPRRRITLLLQAKNEALLVREAVALGIYPPEMVAAALASADAAFAHDVPLSAERLRAPGLRPVG